MIALTGSRFATLCLTLLAPIAVAIACAKAPVDPGPSDDGNCPGGFASCNGVCTDVASDSANCGTCGRSCLLGQRCVNTSCLCEASYTSCGATCANTQTDPANCGTCGMACPATAPYCSAGVCSSTCGAGLATCGQSCVNVTTDLAHCGSCGNPCPVGRACSGGICGCPVGQVPCGTSCAPAGTCGAGGASGSGGSAGSGAVSGSGGTSGAGAGGTSGSAGTAGAGGTPAVMKLCASKVTVAAPLLTDFETYNGMQPVHSMPGSWGFSIGMVTYSGLYPLTDATGSYTLSILAGASSDRGASATNATASNWGGGIGFWMGPNCIDARAYRGLTFWARGSTPTTMMSVGLGMEDSTAPDAANPAGGGTCSPAPVDGCAPATAAVTLTPDWTQFTILWADFMPGRGPAGPLPASGDEITGFTFQANMNYVPNPVDGGLPEYVPEPGAFTIELDNLGFAP